jgi:carboxyl-terminal processing protease
MKNLQRNSNFIAFSSLLLLLIFGSGYYVGNSNESFLSNNASANESLDLNSFWEVYNIMEQKFVDNDEEKVSNEEKVYGAISGLVDSYGDPYTVFLPPAENEQFEESISGVFEGVGMEIGQKDGFLTVVSPLKNSPAEKSGIKKGDKIIAIDDKSAMDISVDDAIKKIRGEKGTSVELTVIREGEKEPLIISITRDKIIVPTIETSTIGDVYVISLFNFSANASADFRNALRDFVKSKKNKLILDLRGNPGGFLESSIDISSWFLPIGKTVVIENFGNQKEEKIFRSKGYNIFNNDLKMIILVDQGSASASEIVAGALQEHGVAKLVGEKTFGKGSVQELVKLTDNTSLKITIAKWLTPNKKPFSDGGIPPDVEVKFDSKAYDENNKIKTDNQLQKALEMLR